MPNLGNLRDGDDLDDEYGQRMGDDRVDFFIKEWQHASQYYTLPFLPSPLHKSRSTATVPLASSAIGRIIPKPEVHGVYSKSVSDDLSFQAKLGLITLPTDKTKYVFVTCQWPKNETNLTIL